MQILYLQWPKSHGIFAPFKNPAATRRAAFRRPTVGQMAKLTEYTCYADAQKSANSQPRAVTRPAPVTTTRLFIIYFFSSMYLIA